MTDARLRLFWHRAGPPGAIVALVAAGAVSQGCGGGGGTGTGGTGGSTSSSSSTSTSSSTTTSTSTTTSSSSTTTSSSTSTSTSSSGGSCTTGSFQGSIAPGANGGFTDPFDAHPSSDGSAVFFTAIDMNANPGVFKQTLCPAGGAATPVYTGGEFISPFGIAVSSDDMSLFVSDPGAVVDPTDPTKDNGVLFKLSAAGGSAPSHLVDSVQPRSLTVHQENGADVIYFTGTDKANGMPGVFKVPASGGTATVVAEGAPFSEPGGLAVTAAGTIYVLDTSAAQTKRGSIIVVTGGTATEFVGDLQAGYPAGIALMSDDSELLASGMDPTATSNVLFQVTVATKAVTPNTNVVGAFSEAAGLHRARSADVFAWADSKATPMGMTGTGTVFVIK